ncbi:RagB/SusD family nutrient uptake outer membrane protein [Longitalea arenae]|uniref:RagB/SusD family nutrient uptake outer membrane protein n=1 Tax=Longitalea arenae TaxID=2812558 RepID=UPI0019688BDD|nr:RagB/SusD family nutrient uptake outer membrane protein [Longitalea arenae]
MKNIIWFAIVALTLSSCKKWLDVSPVSQVSEEELFKSPEGFEEALTGIYSRCSNMNLYGFELTGGLPDVLAQNYSIPGDDWLHYRQTVNYNYNDRFFIAKKDTIWGGLYNAIANCNLLLKNLESQGGILTPDRRQLIRGEALALRAFLHFDLLRLFAPSFSSNPSAKAIPYVTEFSNSVTGLSAVSEVLTKIATDLEQAKELTRPVDPIVTAGYKVGYNTDVPSTEESSASMFLQNRRHRMNYYAICGELARVNLYMDKKSEALRNALEVINSNKFPWTTTNDFINADPQKKDRILYKELVFAWYAPHLEDTLSARFNTGVKGLIVEKNTCEGMYQISGGGGDDLRYKHWFNAVLGGSSIDFYELQKYKRDNDQNRHYFVLPALRLSEIYYIASESAYDTDPVNALLYLNTVRKNRGIQTDVKPANKEELMNELVMEARKEMYGEGQLFYMYKRLNRFITGPVGGSNIPPSDKVFVMPLPDNEIEFGQR